MSQATLHQLKVFEATARQGSFTKAAEELEITQPTVSTQVKQLTLAVGLPLFEQIGKRLYLTDAGTELLATCQEIFEQLDNFEMKVADWKGTKQGRLNLGIINTAKEANGELTILDVQHFPIQRYWYVAYLGGKQLSVIAQTFWEYLLEEYQNPSPAGRKHGHQKAGA